MKRVMLTAIMLFTSTLTLASGQTDYGLISTTYVNHNWTMVHIPTLESKIKGSKNNPDSCESNYYFAIIPSDPNYSTLHSTLMAAHISGKKVAFWINGCGGQNNKYPRIYSVWMK